MEAVAEQDSLIDRYTYSLNAKIEADPVRYQTIDREAEIERIEVSLLRKDKSNPLLISEPGVGKTNTVEGLVKDILEKNVSKDLADCDVRVFALADLDGSDFSGSDFKAMIEEVVATHGQIILFIDEIHNILNHDSSIDAGNILKPYISRGEIRLIGATTIDEFHDHIESDMAMTRRFDVIEISEPSSLDTKRILRGVRKVYELQQGVKIEDTALDSAVDLSVRYISSQFLPDKAIGLIDEAAAYAHLRGIKVVNVDLIANLLQKSTGIPISSLLKQDSRRVDMLDKVLKRRVKGQNKAISDVLGVVRESYAGLQDPKRPLGSFLFLGPTGTGKTETALALAEGLFDDENAIIKIDCSEFQAPNSGRELTGYGHKRGILTEKIRHKPYCVLDVDEIEKADHSVHDLFLQILDKGVLSDNYGRPVSFKNVIVIMTTNLASDVVINKLNYSSLEDNDSKEQLFNRMIASALEDTFRPEFLNRIDHKVVFDVLSQDVVADIVKKKLKEFEETLNAQHFGVTYDDDLVDYLATVGYDPENGARPIARAIHDHVIAKISLLVLKLQTNNPEHFDTFVLEVRGKFKSKYDKDGTRHVEYGAIRLAA